MGWVRGAVDTGGTEPCSTRLALLVLSGDATLWPSWGSFWLRTQIQGTQGSLQRSPVTLAGGHEETHLLFLLIPCQDVVGGEDTLL